jgi:hypothetical protein
MVFSHSEMRRTIALALVVFFSWTLIAPVLSADADANLPACCRRNGNHHCMMRGMGQQTGTHRGFTTFAAKCPCTPAIACVVHSPTCKPDAAAAFYAKIVVYPAGTPQTEARSRISSLRSHQKRGPPTPLA